MNPSPEQPRPADEIERAAAEWVLRRDRGFTAAEQDAFSQWLAADARHGAAFAQQRWGWDELDRLTGLQTSLGALPDPDLLSPRRAKSNFARRLLWFVPLSLAAAAATVFVLFRWQTRPPAALATNHAPPATTLAAPCERRVLDDGSTIELNRGAAVEVAFVATERRVRLVRGEASFTVAKDPARPFVVDAGGVHVQAVGTVFNVKLDHAAVEVLVSEGKVQVEHAPAVAAPSAAPQILEAKQSARVPLAPAAPPPPVATLTAAELDARLAWQPRLLDFDDKPLADIVTAFNRRNPVQLTLADPALATMRLSATFRSDNVEGFVRLMQSDFGMKAEWRSEKEIALSTAR